MGVIWMLCSFRLVLEGKAGKEIPQSSRFKFLEKIFAKTFAFSEAENNTLGLLNGRNIAVLLLLRPLSAVHHNLWEPGFWEVIYSVLLALARLSASRILLQHLLDC